MAVFDENVISAVVAHMDDDHAEDNLLIARAFGAPEAETSRFVNLDENGGYWLVTEKQGEREIFIPWPSGKISERPEIRREVVLIHNAASEKLGVKTPVEDQTNAEQHGLAESAQKPFSAVIRESSWGDHDDSEGADFMANIMRGQATLDDYVQLVIQHYFMYEALEDEVENFKNDPTFAPFHDEALVRMKALEADLEKLVGADWKNHIEPHESTSAYAARIRQVGKEKWLPGLIAHHYTRYLGDLSGGQMISRRVSKQHSFEDGKGVEFYNFESLGGIDEFKQRYRSGLDALGATLGDDEKQRMIDEVREAYRFNTAVFIDMARAKNAETQQA